jgi:hypothetical protein
MDKKNAFTTKNENLSKENCQEKFQLSNEKNCKCTKENCALNCDQCVEWIYNTILKIKTPYKMCPKVKHCSFECVKPSWL